MQRKAAIRKFKRLQMKDPLKQKRRRGRKTYYGPDVTAALKTVWGAANEPCGELLHPLIPEYVAILQRDRMWKEHSDAATKKLLETSEHTVRRRVGNFLKARGKKRGISATKPSHGSIRPAGICGYHAAGDGSGIFPGDGPQGGNPDGKSKPADTESGLQYTDGQRCQDPCGPRVTAAD